MNRLLSRWPLIWVATVLICTVTLVSSCKLRRSTLRNSMGEREGLEFIVPGTLEFKRDPIDARVGILRFETKFDTYYSVHYWVQGENENNPASYPCENKQDDKACEGQKAQRQYEIRLNLDKDKRYSLRLFIWPTNISKRSAKSIRIDEGGANSGGDGPRNNTVVDEIIVARTIVPQQTSEVYRHKLDTATTVGDLLKKFQQPTGCAEKFVRFENPFPRAEDDLGLKSLSSSGFAQGTAKVHPNFANRLKLVYDHLEFKSVWEWAFEWEQAQKEFTIQPGAYLNKISLITTEDIRLRNKQLVSVLKKHNLPATGAVKFRWEPYNLTATSYLSVFLKAKNSDYTVSCVFPGDGEQDQLGPNELPEGTIDAAILQKMPADEYDLLVFFESTQTYVKSPNEFPTWFLTAQDWRFDRVQKP